MKKLAGPLRVELAQYRELAAFAQFGSDLSRDTLDRLRQGERIVEILKQPQYKPLPVEEQVLLLYAITNRFFSSLNVERIGPMEDAFLQYFRESLPEIVAEIREKKEITPELEGQLRPAIERFVKEHGHD